MARANAQLSDTTLRRLIAKMIRRSAKKRAQIAEELSARLGQHITVHMLNSYTSESNKSSRFPATWLPAFSDIIGDDSLERLVISRRNRRVLEFGEAAQKVLNVAARKGLAALRRSKHHRRSVVKPNRQLENHEGKHSA